jgi:hypothetical protein
MFIAFSSLSGNCPFVSAIARPSEGLPSHHHIP